MDIKIIFGNNVKKYREKISLTQEVLADISGIHRTYISGIERGVRNPTITVAAILAESLNIEPSALFKDE